MVHALFAEWVDTAKVDIGRWCLAHALDNDGWVGFEDDAVVYNLIHGEGYKVVALNDGALVDGGLEEEVQGITEGKDGVVEQYFVFFDAADEVEHHVAFGFVEDAVFGDQSCSLPTSWIHAKAYIRPSNSRMSPVCFAVFSSSAFSKAFCDFRSGYGFFDEAEKKGQSVVANIKVARAAIRVFCPGAVVP